MFQNFKDCWSNNKNVYRSQQRFKSYNHDVYTEEVNKVAISNNDDKRIQTSNGIETYPYGTNAFKVCEIEMLNNKRFIVWNIKMINSDNYINENNGVALKIEYNKNLPYIPDHPYRILIIRGSGSGKTNLLLNLIENQPDIDERYLCAEDP